MKEPMLKFKCVCKTCNQNHEYEMTSAEFKMLASICKNPTDESGRLLLACDKCQPMKYSAGAK